MMRTCAKSSQCCKHKHLKALRWQTIENMTAWVRVSLDGHVFCDPAYLTGSCSHVHCSPEERRMLVLRRWSVGAFCRRSKTLTFWAWCEIANTTLSADGRALILQLISPCRFVLTIGDVQAASCDGRQGEAQRALFVTVPKSYVNDGMHTDQLFEVRGGYGLRIQPRQ